MRPLLCVRNQASAPLGTAADALRLAGVSYRYHDAWISAPARLEDASGLIVLGGEMGARDSDDHPWLTQVHALVAEAVERRKPVLGVCLGAQILARVLGAEVTRARVPEIGFHPIVPTPAALSDPVAAPFARGAPVFQWHRDAFDLPAGAKLLFSSENVANQGFAVDGFAYGLQFHFEVDEAIIAAWCDEDGPDRLLARWGVTKQRLLAQSREHLDAQRAAGRAAVRAFASLLNAA
jgi:GMP synthase (glutamine-hydrolysing)